MIYQERRINRQRELERQQEHWNEVHENLLAVQKKSLEISDPNDDDEKEADAVARKVVDGQSAEIHGTGGTINRKGEGTSEATPEFQSKLQSNIGGGQSLDDSTKSEMESKMGADFSGVKIHTGSEAHNMSESINAKAFTHGQDVFFKNGQFDTNSKQGKELLAHELTHTVQQSSGKIQPKIQRVAGDGTKVRDDLDTKDYRKALQQLDIDFLTKAEVGQNILLEQGIAADVGPSKKMSMLQAAALAYNYGMLKLRMEYAYGTGDYKHAKKQKDIYKDDSSVVLDAGKFNKELDRIKDEKDLAVKKADIQTLVDRVLMNPDMSVADPDVLSKTSAMQAIKTKLGGPGPEILMTDETQNAMRDKIRQQAELFFFKMIDSGWVDTGGIERNKIVMPDQFLSAVGDRTISTGIANSDIKSPVGLGYFMYDKDNPDNTNEFDQSTYQSARGNTIGVRNYRLGQGAQSLYGVNDLYISFDPGQPMEMRFAAYGFDFIGGSAVNKKSTLVKIYVNDAESSLLEISFEKGKATPPASLPDGITLGAGDLAGSVTLIFDQVKYKDVCFHIQTVTQKAWDKDKKINLDTDEVQVQLSTTGKIGHIPEKLNGGDIIIDTDPVVLDVYFDLDSDKLTEASFVSLDKLLHFLTVNPTFNIEIDGYTDNRAKPDHNLDLSNRRANAVRQYLINHGIDGSRMTAVGFGEANPVVKQADIDNMKTKAEKEAGYQKNRRVEYHVVK